jgi:hypothetical protein
MQLLFQKPADDEAWPTFLYNYAKKGLKIPEAVGQSPHVCRIHPHSTPRMCAKHERARDLHFRPLCCFI